MGCKSVKVMGTDIGKVLIKCAGLVLSIFGVIVILHGFLLLEAYLLKPFEISCSTLFGLITGGGCIGFIVTMILFAGALLFAGGFEMLMSGKLFEETQESQKQQK